MRSFPTVIAFLAATWIFTCLLGFGLGLVPRRWIWPAAKTVVPPALGDWRPVHVGDAHDALSIGSLRVWKEPWRPIGMPPVSLPHPAYAHETHSFEIYEIGSGAALRCFAAAELSKGFWGFYEPKSAPTSEVG